MPAIDFTPVMKPLSPEELLGRLQRGWTIAGQVLLQQGSGVATPDNPNGATAVPVNVWTLPEPMVPLGELISTLLAMDKAVEMGQLAPGQVLESFAQGVIGVTIEQLRQTVERNKNVSGATPDQDQDDDTAPGGAHTPSWIQ